MRYAKQVIVLVCLCGLALRAQIREYCWVETQKWSANGVYGTSEIQPGGEKWQLRFRVPEHGNVKVVLHGADGKAKIVLREAGPTQGVRRLPETAAGGHLTIVGSGVGATVSVEQYMDSLQEWRHRQKLAAAAARLTKFAVWAGEGGHEEYAFEAPAGVWVVRCRSLDQSDVKFQVSSEDGTTFFRGEAGPKTGELESYIHQGGRFRLVVEGHARWRMEAFSLSADAAR